MVLLLSINFNRRQSPFYRYQSRMVLRRHGGVLLLRPLVDFYSGVDTWASPLKRLPNKSDVNVILTIKKLLRIFMSNSIHSTRLNGINT